MLEPLYIAGNSRLHRLPAGLKLLALCAAGRVVRAARSALAGLALAVAAGLVWSSGAGAALLWRQLRGLAWVLLALGLFTGFFRLGRGAGGAAAGRRDGGLALAVTLTTRTADLIAVCEWALPLQRLGLLDAGKVALALALALRFVPEIWRNFHEIREAQAARGLGANPLALIVPLIVLTLKRAQEVSEAIDARSP